MGVTKSQTRPGMQALIATGCRGMASDSGSGQHGEKRRRWCWKRACLCLSTSKVSASLPPSAFLLPGQQLTDSAWEGATLLCLPRNCQSPTLTSSVASRCTCFPQDLFPSPAIQRRTPLASPRQGIALPVPLSLPTPSTACRITCKPSHHPLSSFSHILLLFSGQPDASLPTLPYPLCLPDSSPVSLILPFHSITLFPCFCNVFRLAFVHLKHSLIYYFFPSVFP